MQLSMLTWPLVLLLHLALGADPQTTDITEQEVASLDETNVVTVKLNKTAPSQKVLYERVLVKFDAECLEHSDVDLVSHFKDALSQLKGSNIKSSSAFAGFASRDATTLKSGGDVLTSTATASTTPADTIELPEPDAFEQVLKAHMTDAKVVVGASTLATPTTMDMGVSTRRLGAMSRTSREHEILSAFHLLASSLLVGEEHVSELVKLEKSGKYEDAVKLIQNTTRVKGDEKKFKKVLHKLEHRHMKKKSKRLQFLRDMNGTKAINAIANTTTSTPGAGDGSTEAVAKALNGEANWMSSDALSVVTDVKRLGSIEIDVIENPFMEEHMLTAAQMLPCMSVPPEPDRLKDTTNKIPKHLKAQAQEAGEAHRRLLKDNGILKIEPVIQTVTSADYNVSTKTSDFLGFFKKKDLQEATSLGKQYTLLAPNDTAFSSQWYLLGSSNSQQYGSYVVDGWGSLLVDLYNNEASAVVDNNTVTLNFADLERLNYNMTVAVLDSGCSRNADLINQFWRNPDDPSCVEGVYEGTGASTNSQGISGDCVGYDFGDQGPDPTHEVLDKTHGSGTSGVILAEGNNGLGVVGICPHCRLMCLKIYDTETKGITMSSVLSALDYIAEKKVKVSNHSYGGFGYSQQEYAAHQKLHDLGLLVVVSAGNNGCDLDAQANDEGACIDEDTGAFASSFTPATFDIESLISVASTDQNGEVAYFSNWGATSVDIFAPGTDIMTLYGETQLGKVQGTSFSAPIVTGIAAMLWSHRPELTAVEVKKLILSTGTPTAAVVGKSVEPRVAALSKALEDKAIKNLNLKSQGGGGLQPYSVSTSSAQFNFGLSLSLSSLYLLGYFAPLFRV